MAFFYISKNQFLPVILLSYTFITSLLITRCSSSSITFLGIANSDIDIPDLPERTNALFLDQAKSAIEKQEYISYTLDCAEENSFQEKTLNLKKALKEESIQNTRESPVFKIRLINTTPECQQQLASLLKDIGPNKLYKTSSDEIAGAELGNLEVFVVVNASEEHDTENSNFDISKIQVMHQGVESSDIAIILVILILLGLSAAGVVVFIKRKKRAQKKQLKVEKQKFIPRLQLSAQAPFNGQKEAGSKGSKGSKKNKNLNLDIPKILSPNGRGGNALRLEDNHQSSIINDNIFTNLDNSPRSVDDESDIQSVKNTPKDIGFNIEFSMIEQDSKIKSARDNDNE